MKKRKTKKCEHCGVRVAKAAPVTIQWGFASEEIRFYLCEPCLDTFRSFVCYFSKLLKGVIV
jgi:hypothetical protein